RDQRHAVDRRAARAVDHLHDHPAPVTQGVRRANAQATERGEGQTLQPDRAGTEGRWVVRDQRPAVHTEPAGPGVPSDLRPAPGPPRRSRGVAPGPGLAVRVHAGVRAALAIRGGEPAGGRRGPAAPGAVNFFVLSRGTPTSVDVALTPHVPLPDLSGLRRIAIALPPLDLPRPSLPLPVMPLSGGTGGAEGARAGGGPATGAGPGTGEEGGYILHAAPRTAI